VTGRVRVAGKGLKVAEFSARCGEAVRVAKKGVIGEVVDELGRKRDRDGKRDLG